MNTETNLLQYADQKLKAHTQNNEQFNLELATLLEFYKKRLFRVIRDEDQQKIDQELFASIKSQVFNGYFIGLEVLQNPDTEIPNDFFTQTVGNISLASNTMLLSATGENPLEIITLEPLKKLMSWMVQRYEDVYPLLMEISLNTACMGAKWALLDEGIKRGLAPLTPQHIGGLADFEEINFISPQHYLMAKYFNESAETWELYNFTPAGSIKLGEATILKVYNPTSKQYSLSIYLSNRYSLDEQQDITDSLCLKLMARNELERQQILLNVASVEEFYGITG